MILIRYITFFEWTNLLHFTCKSTFSNKLKKALSLSFSTIDKKLHSPAAFKSFFLSLFNSTDAKHLLLEGIIKHRLPLEQLFELIYSKIMYFLTTTKHIFLHMQEISIKNYLKAKYIHLKVMYFFSFQIKFVPF